MEKNKSETIDNLFTEVIALICDARNLALQTVNKELIHLYWQVGKYISGKVNSAEWGKSVVASLAEHIKRTEPDIRGFSDKNLWRMKQFYEIYQDNEKLATLCRELSWSHNRVIFGRCKTEAERQYYLSLCIKERYSVRDLN
jgi:predicted nuclease of restriction endonuclease-like (RecB) superfamily